MPFDFFDGLGIIGDLVDFLGSSSDSTTFTKRDKPKKKSKYYVEWWSGSLLFLSSIVCFFVFKDPLPIENFLQTLLVCILIGCVISFVIFFALYHLGFYYFKNLFKLLLLSGSVIVFSVAIVLYIYYKSTLFFT